MSTVTYKLTGALAAKVRTILTEREVMLVKLHAYCDEIGADKGCLRQGPYIIAFSFSDTPVEALPPRWQWVPKYGHCYAARQNRSKADKAEWKRISEFHDTASSRLSALFYNNPLGFNVPETLKWVGVGVFATRVRDKSLVAADIYAEVALGAPVLEGMVEILRSEYDSAKNEDRKALVGSH